MNGVLFVDKPKGMTSFDVVREISKIFQTKKVGHTGTLDPLATGVLIVCLGSYTKLVDHFTSQNKSYIASMKFGIQTDTGDITGKIIHESNSSITEKEIYEAFEHFPREYIQTVPKYAAVKVNGKRLYEYARNHEEVELPKRKVMIYSLKILNVDNNVVTFETTVSKGTYIRSLIEDIANLCGEVATMMSLRRTRQGTVSIDDCILLSHIRKDTMLKKVSDVLPVDLYSLTEDEYKKVCNGNILLIKGASPYYLVMYQNEPVALYVKDDNQYRFVMKV